MFTGIVEEVGSIQGIKKGEKSSKLLINARKVLQQTKIGDSICTNGVCLTVTNLTHRYFEADVMAETLRCSNLGQLSIGSGVNLERALRVDSRLGGHIVSGHIDGLGEINSIIKEDNATWIAIKTNPSMLKYIIKKGSIAIDGVSLTVADVNEESFTVSIIPHTGEETILLYKRMGDTVNLECDVIGKYVEKLLGLNCTSEKKNSSISEDFLQCHGFM